MDNYLKSHGHRLLQAGILLILIGLISGFLIDSESIKILGIAAHLAALICGILLISLGSVWPNINLSKRMSISCIILVIYATYGTWATYLFAAVTGAGGMFPIASKGVVGSPIQEKLTSFAMPTVALSFIAFCILMLIALRQSKSNSNES